MEDDTALRVSQDGPCDPRILELLYTDFTGESTVGLVENILSGYFKTGAEVFACEEEIKGWRGDDNFCDVERIISLPSPSREIFAEHAPN